MKKRKRNEEHKKLVLIMPIIIVFLVLSAVVFFISKRISTEMSESAIDNLSGSLDLIGNTIETI